MDEENGKQYILALDLMDLLNTFHEEKTIIKSKLLNEILEYDKVSKDNFDFGFSESLDYIHREVEELFENPIGFTLEDDWFLWLGNGWNP